MPKASRNDPARDCADRWAASRRHQGIHLEPITRPSKTRMSSHIFQPSRALRADAAARLTPRGQARRRHPPAASYRRHQPVASGSAWRRWRSSGISPRMSRLARSSTDPQVILNGDLRTTPTCCLTHRPSTRRSSRCRRGCTSSRGCSGERRGKEDWVWRRGTRQSPSGAAGAFIRALYSSRDIQGAQDAVVVSHWS